MNKIWENKTVPIVLGCILIPIEFVIVAGLFGACIGACRYMAGF